MHSALKHDSKAAVRIRAPGVEIERAPRRVTIHEIESS